MKLTTFSIAKKTKNETKPIRDSEGSPNMKVKSRWAFFQILPCQQLFAFKKYCMETKLYNIFKNKNTTNLTEPILKSSYKVLLEAVLYVTLRRPVYFLWAVEFLGAFNLQIDITLVIF